MYTSTDIKPLFSFFTQHEYNNLHTRKNKQVNNKQVLKHLHGMQLKSKNIISCYFCGSLPNAKNMEIMYEINVKGNIKITMEKGITHANALNYIDSESKEVMKKVRQVWSGFYPKYKKGHFYIKRSRNLSLTPAANNAVSQGVLTIDFVKKMASWNLSVIEGR